MAGVLDLGCDGIGIRTIQPDRIRQVWGTQILVPLPRLTMTGRTVIREQRGCRRDRGRIMVLTGQGPNIICQVPDFRRR